MLDVVKEINEKRHSSVIVMESGEQFWLTWTQLQEHEPFNVGMEVDTDELRQWLLPRQYPSLQHIPSNGRTQNNTEYQPGKPPEIGAFQTNGINHHQGQQRNE